VEDLKGKSVYCDRNKFYNTGPWFLVLNTFTMRQSDLKKFVGSLVNDR